MKLANTKLSIVGVILMTVILFSSMGCDEGKQMMDNVVTEPADTTIPEPTDLVVEVPTTTGDMKKPEPTEPAEPIDTSPEEPEPTDPEPETKEPELEPADTTAPTVVKVGWYTDKRLVRLMLNNRHPGDTGYVKVIFSEPVEHIVGDDVSARPALSIVVGGQATRLRVLPHDAGNRAFVSGTCKPIEGNTDTFACKYTVPAGSVGTVALQVGEETADIAGNTVAESHHIAPFMIEEPEPAKPMVVVEVVPALKTLVPPTSQEHPPPESGSGDFVGQIRTFYSTDGTKVNSTQPIAGVSVTITAGSRTGEQVITDQGGYYLFPNINEDELYLRVEKEHFEPKEVIVYRTRPTVSQRPTGPIIDRNKNPWNIPGTVIIGQRWPDAVRFIFEETLLPDDLMFVRDDGYKSFDRAIGQYVFSGRLSGGIINISASRIRVDQIMMLIFGHELAHAHQHAVEIVNNTDSWIETPEGKAYARAREKDWDEVGRSPLDQAITDNYHSEAARLLNGAAEVSSLYWSRGIWPEIAEISNIYWRINVEPGKGDLKVMAPNRYKWAEEWLGKKYQW